MDYEIVEHSSFTKRWNKRSDEDQLEDLRGFLTDMPDSGDPIPGCGMLRKLRFADPMRGKGKRGGLRVIYLHTPEARRVRLLTVYTKDEALDLTVDELEAWCQVARQLRQADREWAEKQRKQKEQR